MLKKLHIQNYALFDSVDVDFSPNLSIITGETGAGKSILLGALGLLLGERAEAELVNGKTEKCIVEGEFKSDSVDVKNFFIQNDLDPLGPQIGNGSVEIIIRREVSSGGKSRVFINDTPVNLAQLKSLTSRLIDIHSQNENLQLNENEFQFYVLDAYAGHSALVLDYKQKFSKFKKLNAELEELIGKENEARKEKDYLEFQLKEMLDAALIEGEEKKNEEELELLKHAEQIKANLSFCGGKLYTISTPDEKNVIDSLNEIRIKINAIASFNPSFAEIRARLDNSIIDLKDIAGEVESLERRINYEPEKVNKLTDRLETIYHLTNKHRVNSVAELLKVQDDISNRLSGITSLEEGIIKLTQEKKVLETELKSIALKLSAGRGKIIPKLQSEIQKHLVELGMPNAQFNIDKQSGDSQGSAPLTVHGIDTIKFLFSANKGKELREVEKVASGGELSRLMLVIKALIAKYSELPAIIFDEIDQGVSGKVAGQVADLVLRISQSMQVIMITHLPQIASRGDAHFLVYKEDKRDKTITRIKRLSEGERVEEIARMISNGQPGTSALKTAEELLQGK